MISFENKNNMVFWLINFSAFLFFAFFLSTRSVQSWAMALTLCVSLISIPLWKGIPRDRDVKLLAFFFLVLAVVWSHTFDGWLTWSAEGDYFIKYALGALCVLAVCSIGVHPRVLAYSIALGCVSSGILAIMQFPVLGRSEGYTNAIRFGNIAILLGVACWFFAVVKLFKWWERAFFVVAGCMGMLASFLSLSRGGWLLLLLVPFVFIFFAENKKLKVKIFTLMCVANVACLLVIASVPALNSRIELAEKEVHGYLENRDAYVESSVGARLEQWRLGWKLGLEKPITGWGDQGIKEGKRLHIESGDAHPSIVKINHTHNDIVEMWASRGVVGVLFILFVYIVPGYIFFPHSRKIKKISEDNKILFIALHLTGFLIPVGYFIFGWTDLFFNLSIGHNFYIFSLIFILAAIEWMKKNASKPVQIEI